MDEGTQDGNRDGSGDGAGRVEERRICATKPKSAIEDVENGEDLDRGTKY